MTVATLVARNSNEVIGGAYFGVWKSLILAGVWSQAVGYMLVRLASVNVKIFSYAIRFTKKFYKFCTFNAMCKENVAINCVTVQRKKISFPSTLTGDTPR
jgi:hypothetical protein